MSGVSQTGGGGNLECCELRDVLGEERELVAVELELLDQDAL